MDLIVHTKKKKKPFVEFYQVKESKRTKNKKVVVQRYKLRDSIAQNLKVRSFFISFKFTLANKILL